MNKAEVADWFTKRLHRVPEASDVYKVAKQFYELGAYSRAQACLQYYVRCSDKIVQFIRSRLVSRVRRVLDDIC